MAAANTCFQHCAGGPGHAVGEEKATDWKGRNKSPVFTDDRSCYFPSLTNAFPLI